MRVLWGFLALSTCSWAQSGQERPNIIFLIGDGMGLPQISAAMVKSDATLHFERFRHLGFIKTHSAVEKVTHSAAGATAFSAGTKTYNGAIGVDVDTVSVPTILEELEEQGYRTGLISTSSITHATPGSFYAHVKYRKLEEEIASYLPGSGVDFVAGGGTKFFADREDGANLVEDMRTEGWVVSTNPEDEIVAPDLDTKYCYLHAEDGMPRMLDGRGDFLPRATATALEYLSGGEEPFFLMVEGSQIDWGGHANDLDYVLTELYDFNEVIGQVLDFAEADGNTLVVVTADHETGGLVLSGSLYGYRNIEYKFATGGHSATLIPVFAYGPGAEHYQGIYQNTEIYHKAKAILEE
ncbi:MAG TPA: alkaline phosphatase [Cytophagales bacterium]|nr:alkaline phosphatase [Cytophagales bacterium]